MVLQTRSQKFAKESFQRIQGHPHNGEPSKEYRTVAKKFPSLIHTCGLAQALAFALAKKGKKNHFEAYLADLEAVLNCVGGDPGMGLHDLVIKAQLDQYMVLSRTAIQAAGWLKRYVETADEDDPVQDTGERTQ